MNIKQNKTQKGHIEGLHCAGCVAFATKTAQEIDGVKEVNISLLHKTIEISTDKPEQADVVKSVLHEAGYDVTWEDLPEEEEIVEDKGTWRRMIVAIAMAVLLMGLHLMHGFHWHPFPRVIEDSLAFVFASVSFAYCALPYHQRALKMIKLKNTNMDTLISLSVTVAYFFSIYIILSTHLLGDTGRDVMHYFDAVGMIVAFVLVGKSLEERAKRRTTIAYRELMGRVPREALVKRDGEFVSLPISEIVKGDILCLRKGEYVAVDGVVIEGTGTVDESTITGEPVPKLKSVGEPLFAATVSTAGLLEYRAEAVGKETLFGKILEAVKRVQGMQAPIQRIADKVASYFVPVILVLALATFVLWSISSVSNAVSMGLFFAISVLAIACPCAMGLATPTAITVAVGRAAKEHLLISNVVALENMSNVTDIVLDKTGTLTLGRPQVVASLWWGETDAIKRVVIEAEQRSTHPLAEAIIDRLSVGLTERKEIVLTRFEEKIGKGLEFDDAQGIVYRIGSAEYADAPTKNPTEKSVLSGLLVSHPNATFIYLSRNGYLTAVWAIEDCVKASATSFIEDLKIKGITPHLLSGDREDAVQALAVKLGITQYRGGLTPENKAEYLQQLKQQGKIVAMVGDGVNDSPSMAVADISIAMATGSDIAKEVSDLTVIGSTLTPISIFIKLSKRTKRIIYENFAWAFLYNLIAVPMAAGIFYPQLYISPLWSAGAMAMSSIIVVANSLRLRRIRL
ncbi:MAG: heavy metal translocating P-type ATPase [Porphyromonas sp.]|nr:heavy metal translocating P-type ATPase [Porphyromonas sp.]